MSQAGKRVLMSAFACSPAEGSESSVGWHWVRETARLGHDVTVLTRRCYQADIEAAEEALRSAGKVTFVYLDLASWVTFHGWRKIVSYFYVYIWQVHALFVGRRLHRQRPFDLVQHITFGSIRYPTFLGALGLPLIFGPLGGGERAPPSLRRGYPLRGRIVDALRDISNWAVRFDPLMHYAFSRATLIVLRTPESISVVPQRYRHRILLQPEIGIDCDGLDTSHKAEAGDSVRVLFAGRSLYWKGMHLGIAAFARLLDAVPQSRLTIVGNGPERQHWQETARRLGVANSIDWVSWVDHRDIGAVYRDHDIFLFPSLHDAGATVIYEAAAYQLPVVCLDLGASAVLVDKTFGVKIAVENRSEAQVVSDMGAALVRLARNPDEIVRLGSNARRWAETQTWASRVNHVYEWALGQSRYRGAAQPAPATLRKAPPRYSVVVPCFNYGSTLGTALDSVLAQSRSDVEILVVDDASTDDTQTVARRYSERITYLRNERNLGHPTTWGRAMAAARGHYLVNLDADDWLLPGYFDRADHALRNDVGVVVNSVYDYLVDENRLVIRRAAPRDLLLSKQEFRRRLLSRIFFRTPGMLLRRSLAEAVSPPDPRIWNADWEFMLRASRGASAYVIADPAAVYRIHDISISGHARSRTQKLQESCNLFLAITRNPSEPAYLAAGERARFAAGLTELYLRIVGSRMSPRDVVSVMHHLRFALSLSGSESKLAALSTLAFFAQAVLEKASGSIARPLNVAVSVRDILPALRHGPAAR